MTAVELRPSTAYDPHVDLQAARAVPDASSPHTRSQPCADLRRASGSESPAASLAPALGDLSAALIELVATAIERLAGMLSPPSPTVPSGSGSGPAGSSPASSSTAASSPASPAGSPQASPAASSSTAPGAATSSSGASTPTASTSGGSTPAVASPTAASTSSSSASTTSAATGSAGAGLPFAEKEKQILKLDASGKVSEVELRRGVVLYQLYQKDPKLADAFDMAYSSAMEVKGTPTSSIRAALMQLVKDGKLSKADATWVYSLSFRAAQFEGSPNALSSSTKGSHGLDRANAIQVAEATLAGIQSGSVAVRTISL